MRTSRRKKFKLKKYDHGGEHVEDGSELPPEGTMMGDLLRALEASGDKTEYEMTEEEGPFQDWMIKYDATQDQAVDAVRKYYDQYYNLGPARQLLADQLRSQGRDVGKYTLIDPEKPDEEWNRSWSDEKAPFTNTYPDAFGSEEYEDSTVDVLKALESYGKTSDTLMNLRITC